MKNIYCKKCGSNKPNDKCESCSTRVMTSYRAGQFAKVKEYFQGDDRLMFTYKAEKGKYFLVKIVGVVEKEFVMNEENLTKLKYTYGEDT